jgi:hypothetical protein
LGMRRIQRSRRVNVQLVHDQHDLLNIREMHIDQVLDEIREVDRRPLIAADRLSPSTQWFGDHEHSRPMALVLVGRSERAGPGVIGSSVRVSATNCTLVSSKHTNGRHSAHRAGNTVPSATA